MEATGERNGGDVERYEALRCHALAGAASGWRLGLAMLQRRGVAAWLRAGQAIPAPPPVRPPTDVPPGSGAELVGVFATMALACLQAG